MASTKWTKAQEAAIDDRGGSLLVSAAAGSGKTAVLTERVVKLIQDETRPIDSDRLLIVTFTNAAAAELRARIALRLDKAVRENPADSRLRRQKVMLSRAAIGTIDAFCIDLLHHSFEAVDIPPDFTIADEGTARRLQEAALGEVLERFYQNEDFMAFANLYGKGRSDRAAGEAILQLHQFLEVLPYREQMLAHFLEGWRNENGFETSPWKQLLMKKAGELLLGAKSLLECAQEQYAADYEEDCVQVQMDGKILVGKRGFDQSQVEQSFQDHQERFEEMADFVDDLLLAYQLDNWDAMYDQFSLYRSGEIPLPSLTGASSLWILGGHKKQVKGQAEQAATILTEVMQLFACSTEEAEQDRQTALPMLEALFEATRQFSALFFEKKKANKVLQFSDCEYLTRQLLVDENGNRTPFAAQVSGRFDVVMVDEYQDTNALQEEIYRNLANWAGDNLFFVGDLKQSIYRFRQADPTIFAEKQSSYPPLPQGVARPYPEEEGSSALVMLDANFRSSRAVVDGVNFLFDLVMSEQVGGVDYRDGQRLIYGGEEGFEGTVSLLVDDQGEKDPEQVADKIKWLVEYGKQGYAAGMVREGKTTRPVQYEDCCILLSTRKKFDDYIAALSAQGIPSYADTASNLFEENHILPLVALMQIIDNPSQDIPFAAVMLSPIFSFVEDELVHLRLLRKRGSLYGIVIGLVHAVRFAQLSQKGETQQQAQQRAEAAARIVQAKTVLGESLFEKVLCFGQKVTALRQLSHTMPPIELLEEIFLQTQYLALVSAMENGAHRREEVARFAAFVETAGADGMEQLVRNIEATQQTGGLKEASAKGGKKGHVTLMTIHGSKGLQFPVVFVAQLNHLFNEEDLRGRVLLHPELGFGPRLRMGQGLAGQGGDNYPTAARMALQCQIKEELKSEQMRLLYVALTRAQDHLYMSVSAPKLGEKLSGMIGTLSAGTSALAYARANKFSDWVLMAFLQHPTCSALYDLLPEGAQVPIRVFAQGKVSVERYERSVENLVAYVAQEVPPEQATVAAIREQIAWQYPAAELAQIPAKVSVTSIAHQKHFEYLARPAFLQQDKMNAAEAGTALHSFLEHADFNAFAAVRGGAKKEINAAIKAEQARQVSAAQIGPEVIAALRTEEIEAFIESELLARIAAADTLYRELDFITAVPATLVLAAQQGKAWSEAELEQGTQGEAAQVLVQGIADLILEYPDHLELVDYKSDHGKKEEAYLQAYRNQLALYKKAIDKRFGGKTVEKQWIYSFDLRKLIAVEAE